MYSLRETRADHQMLTETETDLYFYHQNGISEINIEEMTTRSFLQDVNDFGIVLPYRGGRIFNFNGNMAQEKDHVITNMGEGLFPKLVDGEDVIAAERVSEPHTLQRIKPDGSIQWKKVLKLSVQRLVHNGSLYFSNQKERSPLKFFLLVYGLSAPLWVIELFIDVKGLPLEIPVTDIVAAFTPLIAACILTSREEGRAGVKKLLKRIFDYSRIREKKWYLAIVGVPLLIFLLIYFVLRFSNKEVPAQWNLSFLPVLFLLIFFFLGAIGEEVGYMGYAVESLQKKWNALATSIIIGLPWAIWHYPSILQQGHSFTWILWGTLGTVAFRILTVWLYNNTNKSLFACILFHCLYNTGRPLFPHDEIRNPLVDYPYIHYSVIAAMAILAVVLWGQKTLTNFRFVP